jgi:hypothetical protein
VQAEGGAFTHSEDFASARDVACGEKQLDHKSEDAHDAERGRQLAGNRLETKLKVAHIMK